MAQTPSVNISYVTPSFGAGPACDVLSPITSKSGTTPAPAISDATWLTNSPPSFAAHTSLCLTRRNSRHQPQLQVTRNTRIICASQTRRMSYRVTTRRHNSAFTAGTGLG